MKNQKTIYSPRQIKRILFKIALILCISNLSLILSAQSICPTCTPCANDYTVDPNPDLTATCGGEINIVIVLDESGSVSGVQGAVEDGVLALLNALSCFDANVVIIEFSTDATYVVTNYTQVDGTLISDIQGYFNGVPLNGQTYVPGGFTNWQDGFTLADAVAPPPDLLLFFTDGIPNTINSGGATPFCTSGAEVHNPAIVSNNIKGEGTHVFVVGIGSAVNNGVFVGNAQDISGTTVYMGGNPGCEICTSDYALLGDIDPDDFKALAESLCPCDDGCQYTVDMYNSDICECEYNLVVPQCDDGDCNNGVETYDMPNCVCLPGVPPDMNCDDGDCNNGLETYNSVTCMCDPGVPPNMDCDDGDCNNGVETYNTVTCVCDPGVPPNMDCDDGDCNNGLETYNSTTCVCEPGTVPNMDCDDGICSNGIESYNSVTCECETSPPPNPTPSFTCMSINACNSGNLNLNAIDLGVNGTNVTNGTWSGTAAIMVNNNGTANDITDDYLVPDPSLANIPLTLTLTMNFMGCEITETCSLMLFKDCAANGGSFPSGN